MKSFLQSTSTYGLSSIVSQRAADSQERWAASIITGGWWQWHNKHIDFQRHATNENHWRFWRKQCKRHWDYKQKKQLENGIQRAAPLWAIQEFTKFTKRWSDSKMNTVKKQNRELKQQSERLSSTLTQKEAFREGRERAFSSVPPSGRSRGTGDLSEIDCHQLNLLPISRPNREEKQHPLRAKRGITHTQ